MIAVENVNFIHDQLIEKFGGDSGVIDIPGLEAALARPYATFDGQELYPSAIEKASALLESLAINHPFVDGIKRIAYTLTRLQPFEAGQDTFATEDEKYALVIKTSTDEFRFDQIKSWLISNSTHQ